MDNLDESYDYGYGYDYDSYGYSQDYYDEDYDETWDAEEADLVTNADLIQEHSAIHSEEPNQKEFVYQQMQRTFEARQTQEQ